MAEATAVVRVVMVSDPDEVSGVEDGPDCLLDSSIDPAGKSWA